MKLSDPFESDGTRVLSTFLETPKRPDLANFDLTEKEQSGGEGKTPQLTKAPNSHRRKEGIIKSLHDAKVAFMTS